MIKVVVALAAMVAGPAVACAPDRVTVSGDWGRASFDVLVADEPPEHTQGLMNVPEMPLMSGMLFIYPAPRRVAFWMHNTLIPLDMLFAAPDGTILSIHENAIPRDDTSIPGGDGVQYVLEVNGGMAGRLGIGAGDLLQHPAFGAGAADPCPQ